MSETVLYDERVAAVADARVDGDRLWMSATSLEQATGWKLEPQGLCRGETCVPTQTGWVDNEGAVDLSAVAQHLGQPVVRNSASNVWSFGESVNARRDQMMSVQAPDFSLPDLDGTQRTLAEFRGKKVFLFSWGSY